MTRDRQYNGQKCEDTKEIIWSCKLTRDTQCNDQKCEDTKEIIRRRKPTRDKQYNGQICEDTKEVIRSRKSTRDRQYNGQKCEDTIIRSRKSNRKRTKRQTMIYKTLHRKLKIGQHKPHLKRRGWTHKLSGVSSSCSTHATLDKFKITIQFI